VPTTGLQMFPCAVGCRAASKKLLPTACKRRRTAFAAPPLPAAPDAWRLGPRGFLADSRLTAHNPLSNRQRYRDRAGLGESRDLQH
jgi:hypothetical protein